ncbi:MAG: DUF4184 family protein [Methanobacteriota archaeon]
MPFTAFHVVPVWPLYVRWPHRWDILALSFGAVLPDLEIVTIYPLTGDPAFARGIMHSLLGVVSVNLLLALFAARTLGPWLAMRLDRRYPGRGWRLFARHDVVRDTKGVGVQAASAIVGGLSHLGLDLIHHVDTPLLWPWRDVPLHLGPWAADYASAASASLVVNAVVGVLFAAMVVRWVAR